MVAGSIILLHDQCLTAWTRAARGFCPLQPRQTTRFAVSLVPQLITLVAEHRIAFRTRTLHPWTSCTLWNDHSESAVWRWAPARAGGAFKHGEYGKSLVAIDEDRAVRENVVNVIWMDFTGTSGAWNLDTVLGDRDGTVLGNTTFAVAMLTVDERRKAVRSEPLAAQLTLTHLESSGEVLYLKSKRLFADWNR